VAVDRLCRLCGLSPETLADVVEALVGTGQVVVRKVGGQMVYRAA